MFCHLACHYKNTLAWSSKRRKWMHLTFASKSPKPDIKSKKFSLGSPIFDVQHHYAVKRRSSIAG
jgi:hypothetical protein